MKKCNHPIPIQHFHLLDDPSSPGTPRMGAVCPSCKQSVTIAKTWTGQPPAGPIHCPANAKADTQLTEGHTPEQPKTLEGRFAAGIESGKHPNHTKDRRASDFMSVYPSDPFARAFWSGYLCQRLLENPKFIP